LSVIANSWFNNTHGLRS